MSYDYDVIIVGAGPTGLITANLLGIYNIKTLIVERDSSTSDIPKAIVIDDETLRVCQTVGLVKEVEEIIVTGGGADYFASDLDNPFAKVRPEMGIYGYYPRSKFLQPEFEQVLLDGLSRFPHVDVQFNTELKSFSQTGSDVTAILYQNEKQANFEVHSKYLFGCDGGRSTVRKLLGISWKEIGSKKNGSSFEEPWIILDLDNDEIDSCHTAFYCDPPRPSMNAATSKGQRRFEFMVLPGEDKEEMLSDKVLSELLEPFLEYNSEDVVKRAVVTFNALVAEEFQKDRVLLLGDAAHLTPPFAGQGLNSGIRDSYNATWKVAAICKGLMHPTTINSYQIERKEHVEAMIKLAVGMGNFILTTSKKRKLIRDLAFAFMSIIPPLKRYVTEMRFKPKPVCKEGLFIDINKDEIVGTMIPQPNMMFEDLNFRKFDEALGDNFALVKVGDPNYMKFPDLSHEVWGAIEFTKVTVLPKDYLPHSREDEIVVSDISGKFKDYAGKLILVRPDKYIAGVFSSEDANHFSDNFKNIMQIMGEDNKIIMNKDVI